jgi:hypothetical protein
MLLGDRLAAASIVYPYLEIEKDRLMVSIVKLRVKPQLSMVSFYTVNAVCTAALLLFAFDVPDRTDFRENGSCREQPGPAIPLSYTINPIRS